MARGIECRALAVGKLEGEAGQRDQDKADEQERHQAPQ